MLQHKLCARNELYDRVIDVMKICGPAPEHYARFPHQFSGGQRQRIGIARALILNPDFIVADEPISALDVSIQAQIINLFSDLRDNRGVTFLFISHDLGVVEHLCDDVAVMYLGQLVESASRDALFSHPPSLHPRPAGCGADLDPHSEPQALVQGEIPDPANPRRLPLFIPLPAGQRTLPQRASGAARGGPGPSGRLSLGRILSAVDRVIYF
nr:Glutathione import ATP-binding protein GsiA [Klebsiella pneumoniae]